MTPEAVSAMRDATHCILRTNQHPSASMAPAGAETLDEIYRSADTFESVYRQVVERVVQRAGDAPTTYVVPGSPMVLERTVRLLIEDPRVEVNVVPAMSFLDTAWARLGVDPIESGVRLIDGHRFETEAAGERGPLLVAHTHANWVLSDIKLAVDADEETSAVILQRLGTPDELITEVPWPELDRTVDADHLTALYIPQLAAPAGSSMARAIDVVAQLRQRCPWDQAQTHRSLRRYLIEETYETIEAIDALPPELASTELVSTDPAYVDLEEELGDVLFQVLLHAEIAAEAGAFSVADVAQTLSDKLVLRHPHVFGDVEVSGTDEVIANWERIKKSEKQRDSALDGIPAGLPALSRAEKVLRRAQRAGAELGPDDADDTTESAVGRALLEIVRRAQRADIDPEQALRTTIAQAEQRFRDAESAGDLADDGRWVLG